MFDDTIEHEAWNNSDRTRVILLFEVWRPELSDEERKAFDNQDIAAFYNLGLHEVLLNRYARAAGFARDDYRKLLEPFGQQEESRARWQK